MNDEVLVGNAKREMSRVTSTDDEQLMIVEKAKLLRDSRIVANDIRLHVLTPPRINGVIINKMKVDFL